MVNFTFQDLLASSLAFLFFVPIFTFPGYVVAWSLNLFEFKQRLFWPKFAIAVFLSFSISPIMAFLCWRLFSYEVLLIVFLMFSIAFGIIFFYTNDWKIGKKAPKYSSLVFWVVLLWMTFSLFSLVDLQFGNRTYFSVVSIDYTTRVTITEAVARTGIPPINPTYFPGHPSRLTDLYYFWYILTGAVEKAGVNWIDGRNSMVASAIWAGLALMALIGFYLRIREPDKLSKPRLIAILGISSLVIGGLDIIPNLILQVSLRNVLGKFLFDGVIEHWNEQIATWLTSLFWDPHHVAGLITGATAFLLVQYASGKTRREQFGIMLIAGMAFASCFGLSAYVAIVFSVFWAAWFVLLLLAKKQFTLAAWMMFSGVFAFIIASPYISDLFQGIRGGGVFPLTFSVRTFNPVIPFILTLPHFWQSMIHLAFLPLNYLLELGFFFIAAIIWLKQKWQNSLFHQAHIQAELTLLITTFFLATFVKSVVILNNDFGWRAWLPGQFILLIWSSELLYSYLKNENVNIWNYLQISRIIEKQNPLLALFLLIGILTTLANAFYLRAWPLIIDAGYTMPHMLSQDTHLGERTYAGKLTYGFIAKNIPAGFIIQNNPTINLDRPLGLYGNHQVIISNISPYGVPTSEFNYWVNQISPIFNSNSWIEIDQICKQNLIRILVFADTDPVWGNLPLLKQNRAPLFENDFYAVFGCGVSANFAPGQVGN